MTIERRRRHRNRETPEIEYTVHEAARLLGYSTRWLYKEIAAGRLSTISDDNSGHLRILSSELERFRKTLKTTGREDPERCRRWRVERARAGGYAKSAKYSAAEISAPLQRGLRAAIERRVDPTGELRERDLEDFQRRCEAERLNQLSKARMARWR